MKLHNLFEYGDMDMPRGKAPKRKKAKSNVAVDKTSDMKSAPERKKTNELWDPEKMKKGAEQYKKQSTKDDGGANNEFKKKKVKEEEGEEIKGPVEAHGVKGMKSTPWRKTFRNVAAMEKWLEKQDGNAELQNWRPLEETAEGGDQLNVGDKVHLGFGARGGAGFDGTIIKMSEDQVLIKHENGNTYKGPIKFVTKNEVQEGYKVLPPIDDRYQERSGLEGPFRLDSGKVVYYDPREGKYYDPDSDMYLSHDEYDQHANTGSALGEAVPGKANDKRKYFIALVKKYNNASFRYNDALTRGDDAKAARYDEMADKIQNEIMKNFGDLLDARGESLRDVGLEAYDTESVTEFVDAFLDRAERHPNIEESAMSNLHAVIEGYGTHYLTLWLRGMEPDNNLTRELAQYENSNTGYNIDKEAIKKRYADAVMSMLDFDNNARMDSVGEDTNLEEDAPGWKGLERALAQFPAEMLYKWSREGSDRGGMVDRALLHWAKSTFPEHYLKFGSDKKIINRVWNEMIDYIDMIADKKAGKGKGIEANAKFPYPDEKFRAAFESEETRKAAFSGDDDIGWDDVPDYEDLDPAAKYDDTAEGALTFLSDEAEGVDLSNAKAIPDPYHNGVWQITNVIAHGRSETAIVYLPGSEEGGEWGDFEMTETFDEDKNSDTPKQDECPKCGDLMKHGYRGSQAVKRCMSCGYEKKGKFADVGRGDAGDIDEGIADMDMTVKSWGKAGDGFKTDGRMVIQSPYGKKRSYDPVKHAADIKKVKARWPELQKQGWKMIQDIEEAVDKNSSDAIMSKLKSLQAWNVYVKNNYYNGKTADYSARPYTVLATNREEAREVVLANADAILKEFLQKKFAGGKKVLPPRSARPITEKSIGLIELASARLKPTTLKPRPFFTPDGKVEVQLKDGEIVAPAEQGLGEDKLKEAHKPGDWVIITMGKHKGEEGTIGEVIHGLHKSAEKSYIIDLDGDFQKGSVRLRPGHFKAKKTVQETDTTEGYDYSSDDELDDEEYKKAFPDHQAMGVPASKDQYEKAVDKRNKKQSRGKYKSEAIVKAPPGQTDMDGNEYKYFDDETGELFHEQPGEKDDQGYRKLGYKDFTKGAKRREPSGKGGANKWGVIGDFGDVAAGGGDPIDYVMQKHTVSIEYLNLLAQENGFQDAYEWADSYRMEEADMAAAIANATADSAEQRKGYSWKDKRKKKGNAKGGKGIGFTAPKRSVEPDTFFGESKVNLRVLAQWIDEASDSEDIREAVMQRGLAKAAKKAGIDPDTAINEACERYLGAKTLTALIEDLAPLEFGNDPDVSKWKGQAKLSGINRGGSKSRAELSGSKEEQKIKDAWRQLNAMVRKQGGRPSPAIAQKLTKLKAIAAKHGVDLTSAGADDKMLGL